MIPRLKEIFKREIQPALKKDLGFKNLNMAPKLEKVVINMGLGIDGNDSKILKSSSRFIKVDSSLCASLINSLYLKSTPLGLIAASILASASNLDIFK